MALILMAFSIDIKIGSCGSCLKKLKFIVCHRKGKFFSGAPSLQNWWREAAVSLWVRLLTLSPLFR